MYYPSLKDFLSLTKQANVIPVYKEVNADLDTPVSAFLKIHKGGYSFLLESVEGQEKIARFSFLGTEPSLIFKSKGKYIEIIRPHEKSVKKFVTALTPLDEIKNLMQGFKGTRVAGLPRFYGGLVGYMSYDAVRFFEEIPDKNPDELNLPDAVFVLTDTLLVFDHVNHTIKIISNVFLPKEGKSKSARPKINLYNEAVRKIEALNKDLNKFVKVKEIENKLTSKGISKEKELVSNYSKLDFENMVAKSKKFILDGDVIQVVLSQRFKSKIDKDAFDIYRNLRSINPSPYMFYLALKDVSLVGASPEILVRCEDGFVQTRPIAGTRPRGKSEKEDSRLERELLNDEKERAEHIMLVDLGRNDLGRVCKSGSVKISDFLSIERYSHVMHLVTEVRGVLRKDKDIYDVLRASFPAGTVSGSPKIRAMQIIDSLENSRRGPYAGCVGYFSFSQNMDTCITIRTIVVKDGFAYVQAGAGIVADSDPKKEYLETVNKARALIEAIKK